MKQTRFVDKEDNEYKVGEKMKQNQQAYVQHALESSSNRGRATDDKRAAAESIVTSLLETPENVAETPIQEVRAIKRHFNLPKVSTKRLVKMCKEAPIAKS